jgi:hypothetical protein
MGRSQRHKVYIQGYSSNDGVWSEGMVAGKQGAKNPPPSLATAAQMAPTVTTLTPNTIARGGADITLTVTGTGFHARTVIIFNKGAEKTTYISATQVSTIVKPSLVSQAITVPVTVENGPYKATNSQNFTFT